jgi:hypothetical protein
MHHDRLDYVHKEHRSRFGDKLRVGIWQFSNFADLLVDFPLCLVLVCNNLELRHRGIKKYQSIIPTVPTITTGILLGEDPLDEQLDDEEKNGQGDEAKKASKCPTGPWPGPKLLKILLFKHERCKFRMLRFGVR